MIYLLWNYRGLELDTVVRALHGLISKHRPVVIFLLETKMKNHKIEGVRRRMGYLNGFDVPPVGAAGGLSLWWNGSVEVNILFSLKNLIHTVMKIDVECDWMQNTWVYGSPYKEEKTDFWKWATNVLQASDLPWFCGGGGGI